MPSHFYVKCLDCGLEASYAPLSTNCPRCNGEWREARYDYDSLSETLVPSLQSRPYNLWRYHELLPIHTPYPEISLGEGGTPLIKATNLGTMLGCSNLYIKDERQGPTASFKDRQAAVTIAALKEAGITEAVIASTGNVAISYSAYAARAGIKLWAFLTSLVPAEKMREVAIYGTQVVKVTSSYDQAKQVAAEFARQRGLYLDRGTRSVSSVEAMKTIAFEIAERLTWRLDASTSSENGRPDAGIATPWRAPDWYVQSVSGGLGPIGVQKGFAELLQMRLIDKIPAIAAIQTEGCSPMVQAWRKNERIAEPVTSPRTHIATLSTGNPGRTYTLLHERMAQGGGGLFESVSDEEAFRAMHVLAKMEGLSVEPAAAVAFAGLIKLLRAGKINPRDVIVVNCTGHTMAINPLILGKGWARNVILPSQAAFETPEEGLLAALSRVTEDRYSKVLIVDDTAEARRLILRIMQSQGNYTLMEASNGREALELTSRQHPDLIILDLMMPEMDGFAVLDQLKANPDTASIPVIVVTAKELTVQEKDRLNGQIESLMQKGSFMDNELLNEIRTIVK
ncbi:MAG TPA: pyridoxal-phosphate dependent enzyme [Anaerolineales bacterium]|nr:pyridoxal-phosphate dependent enzyme [Anaerolineales bacterium]